MQPRNTWVRWSGNQLRYAGRITRGPFDAWIQTPEGLTVLATATARVKFAIFGKKNAARRRLWRSLAAAARDESVAAAIQLEIDAYFKRMGDLVYADGLPRATIDFHRLIVLPCVVLNAATYHSIEKRLKTRPAIASLEGGAGPREFLFLELVHQIEAAVVRIAPSPKRPLAAGTSWVSVGVNLHLAWRAPLQGPQWAGHHYVFEVPRETITRATRKVMVEKIEGFESSLPSLSPVERSGILKRAASAA